MKPCLIRLSAAAAALIGCAAIPLLLVTAPASAESASKPAAGTAKTDVPGNPESHEPTNFYVHKWIPMPGITGHSLDSGSTVAISPQKGRTMVVMFLASWCEACQQIIENYKKVANRYAPLHTDFVYVFLQDTKEDAEGFMKEFGITGGILGNHDIIASYHNPSLPTVYVGDRQGWLSSRWIDTKEADIARLEKFLRVHTAF